MKQKIIKVKNLTKKFHDHLVLKNINLNLYENESLAIIGKSGSGKSVLLKCLIGLINPDQGSIKVFNTEIINTKTSVKEKILLNFGVTFQNGALFDSLPVWENIVFKIIRFKKIDNIEGQKLASSIIKDLGLDPIILNQYPPELSGGMQKRVAIARAICDNPKILLFDEPTSGLDPITGSMIDNLIKKTVKKLGISTITITHDMSSVFKYANRVILINNNTIEWEGKPSQMKVSNNQTIKEFLYSNKKND